MRMKDKVVAITGAGSGLGREGALMFAAEGAKVVVSDLVPGRSQAVVDQITAAGGTASAIEADVRVEADMDALVAKTVEDYGRIDVMWANAGVPEPGFGMQPLHQSSLEDWNNIFAVNTTGIYLAFRAAARWMIDNKRPGTLLATSSAASFTAYPGFPMYTASKAAVNGLVRAASLEFGKYGIRANAICPTHGMSVNFALPADAEVLGKSYEEMMGEWNPDNRAMPLRLDTPPVIRDNANLALFLVSDESRYTTGQSIASADGGQFARTSIIFPTDLGQSEDITSGAIPDELRDQIDR